MISETDYRYCPICGSEFSKRQRYTFTCKKGHRYYINPRPTNAVIFQNKKKEIMLVKRRYSPKKGWWDLPGGFTEPEETMEESIKREIKEELGIEIHAFTYFTSYPNIYLYKGINAFTLMFIYAAMLQEKISSHADEISEIVFFPPDKIPYDRIAFQGLAKALKQFVIFSSLAALLQQPPAGPAKREYSRI